MRHIIDQYPFTCAATAFAVLLYSIHRIMRVDKKPQRPAEVSWPYVPMDGGTWETKGELDYELPPFVD